MPDSGLSLDPLYASGGKGSIRYFFLHGGYSPKPFPTEASVEGKVLVFNGHGKIVYDNSPDQPTSQYRFVNRALDSVDGEQDAYVPARSFVETLLKNISIPSLLVAEIPRDQVVAAEGIERDTHFLYVVILTLDRTNLSRASFQDYEYLKCMLHAFVPRFAIAACRISDAYLPGDAHNLCREIVGLMMMPPGAAAAAAVGAGEQDDQENLHAFLAVYAKRYVHEALTKEEILERCLLHIVKMPFELGSSIRYGLILY